MLKFRTQHTRMASGSDNSSISQPGMPAPDTAVTKVQLTNAPTINTSPWAKLIRPMMP